MDTLNSISLDGNICETILIEESNVIEEMIAVDDQMNALVYYENPQNFFNNGDSNPTEESPPHKRKKVDTLFLKENLGKKEALKYRGMTAQELHASLRNDWMGFCREVGLIASSVTCYCGRTMVCIQDRSVWRCATSHKVSIRKGTWFEQSKLSIELILRMAYMWLFKYSQFSFMHESGVNFQTMQEWVRNCENACKAIIEFKTAAIGGEGKAVQIIECRVNNTRVKVEQQPSDKIEPWIFFAMEQDTHNSCLKNVQNYSSESLLEVLSESLLPHTTLFTHIWNAFDDLGAEHFNYLTKDKCITFYDTVTKQEISSYKQFQKLTKRPRPGLNAGNKYVYNLNLCERLYRKCLAHSPNAYLAFLKDIGMIFQPRTVSIKREPVGIKRESALDTKAK